MKIGLISGSAKQLKEETEACKLYSKSVLFNKALEYCRANYDRYFIVSTKYGIIHLTKIIKPYDIDIKLLRKKEYKILIRKWREGIEKQCSTGDVIYIHGGKELEAIENDILKLMCGFSYPLKGVGGIGKQIKWYNDHL